MKKILYTLMFSCVCFFAKAQPKMVTTISYAIDTVRLDSFFLVETRSTATDGVPRPEVITSPQLFRSMAQLELYMSNLDRDAKAYKEKAIEYAQAAHVAELRAQLIDQLLKPPAPQVLQPIPEAKPLKATKKNKKQ